MFIDVETVPSQQVIFRCKMHLTMIALSYDLHNIHFQNHIQNIIKFNYIMNFL